MKQKASKPISLEAIASGGTGDDVPNRPMSPLEAASFIEGMAAELSGIAKAAKLDGLGYFLEMARIEASSEVARIADVNGAPGKLGAIDRV
ncbi:MAG: hypothetical protein LCH80_22330 [Proteobacteria bacterium]|nr:hypothetical protein [Pseudomonadota bacterium]